MKCETCRKRMKVVSGSTVMTVDGTPIRVNNIPVFICLVCGKQVVDGVVLIRAEQYIRQYGAPDKTLDFAACEQKETEDTVVVMQTLGIL